MTGQNDLILVCMQIVKTLNKNPVFKFISSIKMAVPLMIIVIIAVAAGTIFESRYNSDYARLMVYNTNWFQVLMVLLWINIFCATVSRIPFKKHHTGFVITHIGLLTLLIGGLMTARMGIDGQLRIVEGDKGNSVVLPQLVLAYGPQGSHKYTTIKMPLGLKEWDADDLAALNKELGGIFMVDRFIPFARPQEKFLPSKDASLGPGLSFGLKSPFFDISESLHWPEKSSLNMGPATFRIVQNPVASKKARAGGAQKTAVSGDKSYFIVEKSGREVKRVSFEEFRSKGAELGPIKFKMLKSFRSAMVTEKGMQEGDPSKPNPALVVEAQHQGQNIRDVVFAKFPDFSLNKSGVFGLRLKYVASGGGSAESSGENPHGEMGADSGDRTGNTVEFYFDPKLENQVEVSFYKNGQQLGKQVIGVGGQVVTPWMGIQITLQSMAAHAQIVQEVEFVEPQPRQQFLPPSAIRIRPSFLAAEKNSDASVWLMEGDSQNLMVGDQVLNIYFGRDNVQLPFAVELVKFHKKDYPGTETPMSFESQVKVPGLGEEITISMNEPLKHEGFTLYQASYEMNPGAAPASIFSVNQDPGRPVKYAGSLILVVGIAVFVLMRSRLYQKSRFAK